MAIEAGVTAGELGCPYNVLCQRLNNFHSDRSACCVFRSITRYAGTTQTVRSLSSSARLWRQRTLTPAVLVAKSLAPLSFRPSNSPQIEAKLKPPKTRMPAAEEASQERSVQWFAVAGHTS